VSAETALVTGASGHLGANLVRELLQHGYRVVALVRPTSDLSGLKGLDVELRQGDVMDREGLEAAAAGCQLIFHAAAVFKFWVKDPEEVLGPALEGTRNIFAAAARTHPRRIVYTSSCAAVGTSTDREALRTEDDWAESPHNIYHQAKLESEKLAHRLAGETQIPTVVICPTGLLGAHDHRVTPLMRLVRDWVNRTTVTWEGGINCIDVADAARAHRLAAERGRPGARYIAAGDNIHVPDVSGILERLVGRGPRHIQLPYPLATGAAHLFELCARIRGIDPLISRSLHREFTRRYQFYDATRARSELGWTCKPFEGALRGAIAWLLHIGALKPRVAAKIADRFPPESAWPAAPTSR
jgi:dihydroflavonol-4-reductase